MHVDRLRLSKAYKVLDEKVEKSYISWHWRMTQSLMNCWLLVPKMTWRISWISTRAVVSLKICTLMCYFCWKYIKFESNKYRGVLCNTTEELCEIWKKTDLCLQKWHEKFGGFWPSTRESQNLHFHVLLLTKVYNFWGEKLQMGYAQLY